MKVKENRWQYATVKVADRVVQTAIDIIFIMILLIGLYFLVDTIYVFNHSKADAIGPYKPNTHEDMAALQKEAKDAIGWITIDDTSIDYPIMQGKDNYEYLNKDPYGEYSLAGSIYLDSRNSKYFDDKYSILYGHHMTHGYMFGALDDFEDKTFFNEHKSGTIITEKEELPVTVVAFMYTDANDETIFDPEVDHSDIDEYIKEKAINIREIDKSKRIVALTTCKSPTSTRRMIVFVTIDE